ncbi:MAG: DUF5693 family protein [Synergistaceae bacterium]|jgi:hypothetical protein|nr:DUF5693 family protein [Synergistaceae bacterium]
MFLKGSKIFRVTSGVLTVGLLVAVGVCAGIGLLPRLELERDNRDVAIVVDYRDITPLAEDEGIPTKEALGFLKGKGVGGLMVKEFTIDDVLYDVGPDLEGLNTGVELGIPIFYRVAPAQTWQLRQSLETTERVLSQFAKYPGAIIVAPAGEIAAGYPDMTPLASLLKKYHVPVAQIEFSRQWGATQLNWLSYPNLIALHSVANDEVTIRRIDRATLYERLVRSAVERSVRLLVLRPAVSGNVKSSLENFGSEIQRLAEDLRSRGFQTGWPKPVFADRAGWTINGFSALACSLVFLLSGVLYVRRMAGYRGDLMPINAIAFVGCACVLALVVWKVGVVARLVGAFSAALVVTEASLMAMDDPCHPWRSFARGVCFAVISGLAIAALFSEPVYMLRLRSFSGVKLTLALPPLLVLLHDMRRRVHSESLSEFLSRPPLWGELALGVALLMVLVLALFRSDNVHFIPGFEAQIRNNLERFLVARPRNKEVFMGYPCLVLYAFAAKWGLWTRYREILRVGVALGFSSVVNSFCHYHTPLFFILLREFHGLWLGVLLGVFATFGLKYFLLPLWQRLRFLTE